MHHPLKKNAPSCIGCTNYLIYLGDVDFHLRKRKNLKYLGTIYMNIIWIMIIYKPLLVICPLNCPPKIETYFLRLVIIPPEPNTNWQHTHHGLFASYGMGQYQGVLLHEAHPRPRRRYRSKMRGGTQSTISQDLASGWTQPTIYDASMDKVWVQHGVELWGAV